MATSLDRLIRKEVALGTIRDIQPPQEHIGLQLIAPFMEVASDDVIFDYIRGGVQEGLAPARAEDAEAELAQKDELTYGQGRAALIDWSLKDKYTASDVTRYREDLFLRQATQGQLAANGFNFNFVGRTAEDFERRMAREDRLRRRKLDNRLEWLIMQSIETGGIAYNDGKIKFTVNYGRPAGQQNQAPAGGLWGLANSDPIGDLIAVNQTMFDTYGIRLDQAIISTRVANSIWKSNRFLAAVGLPVVGGSPSTPLDPNYLGLRDYSPRAALEIVSQQTGIDFVIYDAVYRTRAIGSSTFVNNKFLSDNKVYLMPKSVNADDGDTNVRGGFASATGVGYFDDTEIGFAKMLTAPHPEGDWASGYYEWEDETRDPWMHVRGTGIKAFPVFPYMELTYTMTVL
jgi:hypothetical protein